jgi:hypothetical protein
METPPVRYKECRICRKPLDQKAKGRPRKTCSDACRQVVARRTQKAYDRRSTRKRISGAEKALRAMERASGIKTPDEKTADNMWMGERTRLLIRLGMGQTIPQCAVCRRPYDEDRGVREIYCGDACYKVGHKRAELLLRGLNAWEGEYNPHVDIRIRLDGEVFACEYCQKPHPQTNPKRRFCNDNCRKANWRKTHRRCRFCDKWFKRSSSRPTKVFCSEDCRTTASHRAMALRRRIDVMPELLRICEMCGDIFEVSPRQWKSHRFCGRSCYMKNRYREQHPPREVYYPPPSWHRPAHLAD